MGIKGVQFTYRTARTTLSVCRNSALVPVGLLLLARRCVISALTFGAVREKA